MKNLRVININKDDVYKVVCENIYSCMTTKIMLDDIKYHHNLKPKDVPNVLKYGLLSKINQVTLIEKRELTEKEIFLFSDEDHVNGLNNISLSNMQDDFDEMYRDEIIYNAYCTSNPDIIISKDVKAHRSAITYFNEWLAEDEIPVNMFNCINIRIIKFIEELLLKNENMLNDNSLKLVLDYYKYVREIAITMKQLNILIPFREVSDVTNVNEENTKSLTLNLDKIEQLPIINIK